LEQTLQTPKILPDFPDFPEFLKETKVSFNTFHKKQYELSVKMLYPAWQFLILIVTQFLILTVTQLLL